MVVPGRVNAGHMCQFIHRLMKGAERSIILILDGHPIHKAGSVQECVTFYAGKLRVFRLPPYSPELNPDELVWNHVKNHKIGKTTVHHPRELHSKVIGSLRSLQKSPHIVRSFFQEKHTAYAA